MGSKSIFLLQMPILLATAAVCFGEPADPAPLSDQKDVKLLVLGASWAHGVIEDLPKISAASGRNVEVRCMRNTGFKNYLKSIKLAETSPDDPESWVHLETDYKANVRVKEELRSKPWDMVVIQRNSLVDNDIDEAVGTAGKLIDFIKKQAPQAKIGIYQTHAYRGDSELLPQVAPKGWPPGTPFTEEDSWDTTRTICKLIARKYHVLLIPVGDAFEKVRLDKQWGWTAPDPGFDYTNPERDGCPEGEKNSLVIGFEWLPKDEADKADKSERIYKVDDHPNNLGRYLYGAVFYESLFGDSVVGNSYVPEVSPEISDASGTDLDKKGNKPATPERIQFLQQVTHEAVSEATANSCEKPQ